MPNALMYCGTTIFDVFLEIPGSLKTHSSLGSTKCENEATMGTI